MAIKMVGMSDIFLGRTDNLGLSNAQKIRSKLILFEPNQVFNPIL